MKHKLLLLLALGLFSSCGGEAAKSNSNDLTQFVDPYIGTGGHGHVFMGVNMPFGAVQLGPTQIPQEWDWCSGYNIADSTVIGFSHTHLSGTGIGDLADITLMPVTGSPKYARGTEKDPESGLWSYFSRKNEVSELGYYATHLDRYDIDVELTSTERVGFHRYTFPASEEAAVVVDLENGTCWDDATSCHIEKLNDTTLVGWRHSTGWSRNQKVFFAMNFSKPISDFEVYERQDTNAGRKVIKEIVYGKAEFDKMAEDEQVLVKCAISAVSKEGAMLNLQKELSGWDFEACVEDSKAAWNDELSKITVTSDNLSDKKVFYTAMYHTMIAPSLFNDVNGDYRGADGEVHTNPGHETYTTFSLWDTYRAQHPLITLIHPDRVSDMINTMLNICDEQGELPVWHLLGCDNYCMHGNPAISVVSDAIMKGFEGIDYERAFNAIKQSAMLDGRGLKFLKKYGYIPYETINEGITKCMEYNIADGSLAKAAEKLGKTEDAAYFLERSHAYRKYYDEETGFVRGRSIDGKWREPFNPFESVHGVKDYSEGNAWQYTWLAPHDPQGLMELFGGKDKFLAKLDELFVAEGDMGEHASADITGLIGQYVHGNEPSHHIAYLYTYAGQRDKAADVIREVNKQFYNDTPNGICGNEDVGQMSAWYVLSALGFYQIEPAGGDYYFGIPKFKQADVKVGDKTLSIKCEGSLSDDSYIKSITFNGKEYTKNYISYKDITSGGELIFSMTK